MGKDSNVINFRPGAVLDEWLAIRATLMHNAGNPPNASQPASGSLQAKLELGLWQSALHLELRRIRLTLPQACCIADVCNGWLMDASLSAGIGLVYAECYDAFRIARDVPAGLDPDVSSYGAKWGQGADPKAWEDDLLARLISLTPVADHALRDAVARWWADDLDSTVGGFARVGLRVTGTSEETSDGR